MILNGCKQFLYHKTEAARIFEEGEPITDGWYDSPDFENATAMWGDHVEDDAPAFKYEPEETEEPVLYCKDCDKTYKDAYWFAKHMLKEHDIVVEED